MAMSIAATRLDPTAKMAMGGRFNHDLWIPEKGQQDRRRDKRKHRDLHAFGIGVSHGEVQDLRRGKLQSRVLDVPLTAADNGQLKGIAKCRLTATDSKSHVPSCDEPARHRIKDLARD